MLPQHTINTKIINEIFDISVFCDPLKFGCMLYAYSNSIQMLNFVANT